MNEDQAHTAYNRTQNDLQELIERCDKLLDGMSAHDAAESTDTHQCLNARNQACLGLFALHNGDLMGALDAAHMAQMIMRTSESIMALPYVERAIAYSDAQSEKGKAGAAARWSGREGISEIICSLAMDRDALGDDVPPSELWPELYAALDLKGLNPRETGDPLENAVIQYDGGTIKYGAFKRQIGRARSGK